ncbi:hypothetical protein EC973_006766 [Apophysomyces ossiformis]|uniref:Uncharacterized protein n=1 Tax=Apophysomyces ossiformis TaxID=679940 RepID=A0A8H7ES39_9FUNG|nr:hypothetical protein EC973_006766 [Apophysomyces ossiformis]
MGSDAKWAKLIRSADVGDSWVLKFNNLKKLYKLISRYYEEVLGQDFENMPSVDLTQIAKDADVRETMKLCQLILYIAVQCQNFQHYIKKIQNLSNESQHELMVSIDEMMNIMQGEPTGDVPASSSAGNYTPRSSYADDGPYQSQSELSRVVYEELETAHKTLIDEHAQLRLRYDDLEAEKGDLQLRLREMDKAVAQANETGRADFIMRTEIEHLKQDLQRSEDRRQEVEMILETQSMRIEELTRRGEELSKEAEKAASLNDQLDEYRHAAEKLQKAENVIEKYKKKLEESAGLRRQTKSLEEQNQALMERNQQIEEEYRKVLAFKTLMDSYKEQVAVLETKNNELIREKNKMEYEISQLTKRIETLDAEKSRDSDRILSLEERLQEAQLGANSVQQIFSTSGRAAGDDDDMDLDDDNLGGSLEDSLKESNVTELKLANRRLERQLKTLQEENASGRSEKVVVLQHLLDDSNRLKNQFEKNYLEVSQERDILQSNMARIREGIPDALLDRSEQTMSLRLHIIDLEKESKSLRGEIEELKEKIGSGVLGGADMDDFRLQYREMQEKTRHMEEQAKQQLKDINDLLREKDMLQSQTIEQKDLLLAKERQNSDMKASLAAFEAKDDEPLKQQNAHLQQQLIASQEQYRELVLKHRKAKEFIKQQDKMLKETKIGEGGNYDEAVASLKTELMLRDEEVEKLKKQLHETRLQTRREQQLIISAWYEVTRRTHKELVNSRVYPNPNSWLGQQRRTLDNQLKRR